IVALPYFNSITESSLIFPVTWQTVSLIMLAIVFISLATSIYPAFILSSLSPVAALKGKSLTTSKGKFFRNGLVGFQFCIAIVLIITTLIIQKQVDLIGNKQLGFDKEQVMVIEGIAHKKSHLFEPFLNEIRTFPEVKSAAGSLWIQGFSGTWKDNYRVLGQSKDHVFQRVIIGDQLAETLNFELKEGQLFSSDTNDSLSIIVNESAVTQMGLKDPVGQEIVLSKTNDGQIEEYNFIIKGVIKDFNYHTLHNPIEPLMIQNSENNHNRMRFIAAKLTDGFSRETVEKIESKWQEMFPERPFRFRFLDDTLDAKYKNEKKTINILTTFSFLTIFIACIGLFALSSYVIKLRIKEIGIRKILGASIKNIILKLSGNFSLIIFTSFLLAAPIGWYLGSMWLDNFAYKVTIDYEVFFWSGFIVSAVTIMTISFQTFRAAHTNPVDSLRNE
ncbi:MAG: FtsX-like permease family protein, partial [Bacteroidota bacterium]